MKIGDPVTVVLDVNLNGHYRLYPLTVEAVWRSSFHASSAIDSAQKALAHEGATWIHGHHDDSTEQGQALLATHALRRDH